jgi:hypothetical protein
MHRFASLIAGFTGMAISVAAGAADIDWSKVDQALGKPSTNKPGGEHKYIKLTHGLRAALDLANIMHGS